MTPEEAVEEAVAEATRRFLGYVQRWVRTEFPQVRRLPVPAGEAAPPGAVAAAGSPSDQFRPGDVNLFSMGTAQGWWQESMDVSGLDSALNLNWRQGWAGIAPNADVDVARDVANLHVQAVTDRLSSTAVPTIPGEAMDAIRDTLGEATRSGWSTAQTAERLSADFAWTNQRDYWQGEKDRIDRQIDAALDWYGPPGTPAREAAKSGPEYEALRAQRNEATARLDADQSTWETRANRIARTETTGAQNAGSLAAAQTEGWQVKVWIATGGPRTRDSHIEASGQCVPLDGTFNVGGEQLMIPADPAGSPAETINCRCTLVYADSCEEAADTYDSALATVEEEAAERDLFDASRPVAYTPEPPPPPPLGELARQQAAVGRALDIEQFEVDAAFADEIQNPWRNGGAGNPALGRMWDQQGFSGKPTLASKAEVDRLIDEEGWVEVFRGVESRGGVEPGAFAKQFREGDAFPGRGVYGDGSYFSTDRATAMQYAGRDGELGMIRAAMPPDARIVHVEELDDLANRQWSEYSDRTATARQAAREAGEEIPRDQFEVEYARMNALGDKGFAAALNGLDAHFVPILDETYYIIQNRSMLVVERP